MAVLLATGLAAAADRAATDRPATDAPPVGDGELDSAQLQDRPEPLVERTKRDEADQDRIDATVLFASARAHEQRQDYEQALRLYQRAVQAEPGSAAVLRRIIVLAFNLDRRAEAGRYAQLLVSDDADDAILLRRVGLELADQDDMQGALAICQRVEKMEAGGKVTPGSVLLWMELGRLYYMTQQYAQAAEEFAKVDAALNDPAQLGKNESLRKVILSKGEMTYQLFGECYLSADRLTAAQAAFEKANQSKADDALLAYNLARIDARRHEAAAALTLLEKSLDGKLEGQGIEPYQLLAKLLADTGHADQLQGRLEKLHAANPANASLTYYLAETYRKAGKTDLAEPLYRQLCTPSGERGPAIEALQGFIALLRTVGPKEELLGVLGTALEEADGWEGLGDAGKALLEDEKTVDGLLSAAAKEREAGTHRDHADRWVAA
ncbi:MAG TPA: tetratricopeptide repeat protein, partial [Pirellulales bacterium]|nr:tetratricopeptide repeat protein [Pirellulales bacterium]